MTQQPNDELNFVGKVLDNVHGFIWYTEAEGKIIDSLLFKRLQSIKQLSLVNWVFPGSEHTRFIHSLGVMYIADRMAQALHLSTIERKTARLAGLLHDIGHYPLSHVCEFPYKKKMVHFSETAFCEEWNNDTLSRINSYQFKAETEFMKTSKNGHHEEIGALIIQSSDFLKDIITHECGDDAVDTICDMITGNIREDSGNELLVQLLHSELDADGIDYLLRDAMFSGTSFGSFELDQLISTLCQYEQDGKRILCIRPKGIAAADQYLVNKFFSYAQVVCNKHTSILEWMAEQIVSWMQEKAAYFPARETLRTDWVSEKETYSHLLSFTDDYFWHSLRGIVENPAHNAFPEYIVALCTALLNHQECEYIKGSEIKLITGEESEFQSALGSHVLTAANDELVIFSDRVMTKHVPLEEYKKSLKDPDDDAVESVLDDNTEGGMGKEVFNAEKLKRRMYEGICVLDDDETVHLLCDDSRSLMRHLYKVRLLIIRKYKMVK